MAPSMPIKSQEESISSDEADDRARLTPRDTEEGFGVLALRRAPRARSLSAVFDGHSTANGVTGWKRAAWLCSWIAPIAFVVTSVVMVLAIAAERGLVMGSQAKNLVLAVFVSGAIGLVAHVVLVYQVHRRLSLATGQSSRLAVLLQFGVGYSEWREAIERHDRAR